MSCVCPRLYTVRYGTHMRRARVTHRQATRHGRLHAEYTAALGGKKAPPPTHGRHTGQNIAHLDRSSLRRGPIQDAPPPKQPHARPDPRCKQHTTQQAPTTPNSTPIAPKSPSARTNRALHLQEVPLLSPLTRLGPQGHIGHRIMRGNARGARKAGTNAGGRELAASQRGQTSAPVEAGGDGSHCYLSSGRPVSPPKRFAR